MKRIIFITVTFAFISFSNAQNIVIPDANFKAYLVGNNSINLNGDSEIQLWEANSFTGVINASNLGITDLTGIGAFELLTSLNCSNNSLAFLDITNNTNLTVLYCQNNSLTSLNLTQNTTLSAFRCFDNSLTSLDLSTNTSLTSVLAHNNQLTSLNVANGNNTNILGGFFNTTNNPNLICITVDDATWSTTNWTNIDASTNFSTNCACIITIADSNFKNYLINNTSINTSGDSEIQCYEANQFTGTINVNNLSIASLAGIENFTGLTELYCAYNSLTNIDISQNTLLTDFSCNFNQITNLDVSQNTLLTLLSCRENQLTSIDVSNNTLLQYFSCRDNQLTSLDVSNNTNLLRLWCFNNQLTSLNIKNGANTNITNANFNAINNPNLTCIEVDDEFYCINNWTNIDTTVRFSIDCSAPRTYVPDNNFEQALINSGYDDLLDDYVFTENINTITLLNVANKNIEDLTGIEGFTALETLYVGNNLLSALDVSSNLQLTKLHFYNNQITSINLSANINLSDLTTIQNPLTNLDLSQNTALTKVNCMNSSLTSLNIKNGANTNIANSDFNITNNPNLACIEVDDASWSTANWTNIDAASSFSNNCGYTYIPDDNFEQALIDLGLDSVIDNYVTTSNISTLTNLDISNKNIYDLTGIEDFNSLQYLNCINNHIQNLDVSQNTALTSLRCSQNSLTELNVAQNINLGLLICSQNLLTELNVTQNTALHTLTFTDNQITSLDVTQNIQLGSLSCNENYITGLNLSQNILLEEVYCNFNQLTTLTIKNGANTDISTFVATNNPNLTCIEVDNAAWSTANWTDIDVIASFSENCSVPQTYVPDDNFEQALINLGYDTVLDDYVFTANINTITVLDISNKNISDLTGIEDFIALINLNCSNNQLTSLTIINDLDSLDNLNCNFNQLTSLDVEDNIALTVLACRANQLTTLYVSNNTYLEFLSCRDNLLTDLDVSNNPDLVRLWCFNNQLTSLNIKNGSNTNIANSNFNAINNPNLTCIEVDNASWSTTNWTNIDSATSFSENCVLSTDDNLLDNLISIYPNPTKETFKIDTNLEINKVSIFNSFGKLIKQFNQQENYNVSNLARGIYFIKIKSNNKNYIQKLILK